MLDLVLSLVALAAIALLGGAWWMWQRTGDARKALLMVVLAVVMVVNLAIWLVPDKNGAAPAETIRSGDQAG